MLKIFPSSLLALTKKQEKEDSSDNDDSVSTRSRQASVSPRSLREYKAASRSSSRGRSVSPNTRQKMDERNAKQREARAAKKKAAAAGESDAQQSRSSSQASRSSSRGRSVSPNTRQKMDERNAKQREARAAKKKAAAAGDSDARSKSPAAEPRTRSQTRNAAAPPVVGQDARQALLLHQHITAPEPCDDQYESFHNMLLFVIHHLQTAVIASHEELDEVVLPIQEVVTSMDFATRARIPSVSDRQASILQAISCLYQTVLVVAMEHTECTGRTVVPETVYAEEQLLAEALHRMHAMLSSNTPS
jgi:hypothetical protein